MRKRNVLETLFRLFDVQPSAIEQTTLFRTISHEELVNAFTYWIDQSKTLFGESTKITPFHSYKEEGIDVAIDFLTSPQIRFGVQVKSYGDISEPKFSSKVHAQISRSHKHNLSRMILAFAGDMTNSSQLSKVSGMTSEIHQNKGDNDYVIVLSAQITSTIYQSYITKKHPLKFIILDFKKAMILSKAISESLSNDKRRAKVTISVEYMDQEHARARYRLQIRTKFKEDLSLLDQITSLPITGGRIKIPRERLRGFQIYEEGVPLLSTSSDSELTIVREQPRLVLILETVSRTPDSATPTKSLGKLDFLVKEDSEGKPYYEFFIESHPLSMKIYPGPDNKASFSLNLSYTRSDVVSLLNGIEFLQSLCALKRLKINDLTNKKEYVTDLGATTSFQIDDSMLTLIRALGTIQQKSGQILRYPEHPESFSEEQFQYVFVVERAIEEGHIPLTGIHAKIQLPRIKALILLDEYEKNHEIKNVEKDIPTYTVNLLENEVHLGPARIIAPKCRPVGDLSALRQDLIRAKDEIVSLEIESTVEPVDMVLLWFPKQ